MTSSPIPAILPRDASRPARRTTLLAASALCGVAAMLAQPSLAGTLPGIPGAGNISVSTGGSQPVITASDAVTLEIDLNAPRTVINWSSLHVSSGDAMNFHFDAASDLVLNKTTTQIAIDSGGTVTGKVGAATGGNIWFYSPQGVIVSPGATMTASGFVFSKGSGIVDASFVDSAAPLTFLRAAADALIQINTVSAATSASVSSSGDVVLSASSGALNVAIAAGATVDVSTTSGSITVGEARAATGAASVTAGGPGATVTSITGATGVTVSSGANTSVGSATTTSSGDIVLTSSGSVSLTVGNSARDLILSAPLVFVSTIDAGRDVFVTGTTGATVTNRIFAGDDIEVTATGAVSAAGATLRSTGLGASNDGHVLARSTASSVSVNAAQTQGTGVTAGDVIISAATSATLTTGSSSRDLSVSGASASLTTGSATRDVRVTATTGDATVVTLATAGDDVEITTASGDVLAGAATLRSTGLGAGGDAHVLARSTDGSVTVGAAITEGTGAGAGDVTLDAGGSITGASAQSTRDVLVTAAGGIDLASATAGRDITVTSSGGGAILRKAELTGSGAGHDLSVTASDDAVLGDPDYSAITAANAFIRTGGNTGTATVRSTSGDAIVHLETSSHIDTLEGLGVDVTIASGAVSFGAMTALNEDLYAEALDGSMTVGAATANFGNLDLYAYGGGLTITGSVHGAGLVHLGADGLLDGTAASLISSDGDLEAFGGDVALDHVTADGALAVAAATGDAMVRLAEAGQIVQVISLNGAATLRGGEGSEGIAVVAFGKATFGADDKASITAANYAVTDASCGCGTDGLQVMSFDGDAVVNINSASNGIVLVAAAIDGHATVVQKTGDLKIDELAAYDLTLEALAGTLETGFTTSSGGDYTITAHDFLGDALTPDLFFGVIRDVSITDTLGELDLGATAIHADRRLAITAMDGAVTGAAQLSAGSGAADGQVTVTADAIAVDTISSDGLVSLDGGLGLVDVATSVSVDGNYTLKGGDFSTDALAPLGLKAGLWSITDRAGGFDFTGKTLHYGGALALFVNGVVNGGDITVDTDTISVAVHSGHLGALSAGGTSIAVDSAVGGVDVDSAEARSLIRIQALSGGAAKLGAATLNGAGTNQLTVKAFNGDAILGAATPGAIMAANLVSSAGATTTLSVTGLAGRADVHLDHITGGDLTTVDGADGAAITVLDGSLRVANAASANGAVTIDGPTGALTVDQLTAGANSRVEGGGDTRLIAADVTGDLAVSSATGNLRFGDAAPGRVIDASGRLSLNAATDIAQQGVLHAFALDVAAGTGVVLLGDNQVQHLDAVSVTAGGFAFHDTLAFDLYGAVNAVGQTVDLRSDQAIGQVSTGIITAQTLTGASVGGANFGAANQVAQLGAFTNTGGGLLKLVDGRSLTINGAVLSAGAVSLASHGGMTFASTGTVQANGTGDAVVLASDGVFTNGRGADAVTAGHVAGRWLIYTQAVGAPLGSTAGNSFNGLVGKSFYGSAYDFSTEAFATAPNAGNRFVYADRPTLTVAPNSHVVTYSGAVPTTSAAITGLVNGDLAADAWSGAPTVSGATSKAVGTYVLTAGVGSLASDLNYAFAYGTGSLKIDPKALSGVLNANDKTYDGLASATGAIVLTGLIAGDSVAAAGTYAFADKNAAPSKTVTASGVALSGADSINYTLAPLSTAQADILAKSLTGVLTANDKTYDGATSATGSIGLTGVVAGDTVTASGTYAFADKTAAAGKTVTASGVSLSGGEAGNYSIASVSTDTADILRKSLTGTLDANDKTYDGTAVASGTIGLTGVVVGDAVSAGGAYAFADKTAATGKTVTASGVTLTGADAANYDLVPLATAVADILRKSLTGTLTANDKTYDGAAAATGSIGLVGVVAGDTVGAGGSYAFADKAAGLDKVVTASGVTLTGADAANYDLVPLATAVADILRKSLTGTLTANDKTYDGAATATGSIGLTGVVAGDVVAAGGTYAFADKTAGLDKVVTASGVTLSGADAANYNLNPMVTALADILRKALTGTLTANDKTYDGTAAAAGSISLAGVVAGDTLGAAGTYAFADKTAGLDKVVTASGVTLTGADAANYSLTPLTTALADILRKSLTGALVANDKTYDGATTATGSVGLTGVVAGDTVGAAGTYAFADANAGAGKTVTASGVTLSGADAGNYSLTTVSTDLADLLRRSITVVATDGFKMFGQTDPVLTYRVSVGSLVQGEGFTGGLSRSAGENPGDYGIGRGALSLSANYDLTFSGAVFTIRTAGGGDGSMTIKPLTQSPDFTLVWDPEIDLLTSGEACTGDACPPQAAVSGGAVVASLR